MNKLLVAGLVGLTSVTAYGAYSIVQMGHDDQTVRARWSELEQAQTQQFAASPAALKAASQQGGFDAVALSNAYSHCNALDEYASASEQLLSDAERFDRYKQTRAECMAALFQVIAVSKSHPALASNNAMQTLSTSLTQGQATVEQARERYSDALSQYNRKVNAYPAKLFAGLFGYAERPAFVRSGSSGT